MNADNNKRLALNTVMLYFRMLVIMLVTLYTSRITLNTLGVVDFGIYNIVAGLVVLFSFISQALNSACNRFLSIAVGKDDINQIQSTFSTALIVHLLMSFIVFTILELAGCFVFAYGVLNVPEGRLHAAKIIYHLASLVVCINLIRTPFNASIIAHEDMRFYAYSSIVEAVLKLLVVYAISVFGSDKLICYSSLILAVTLIINLWYIVYCRHKYDGNRLVFRSNKSGIKEMISFCGWGTLGGIADISWQQGTNLVLNSFFGVTLNSAMAIANQIKTAVYSVSSNLLMAANPQIVKSYSCGDSDRFYGLIYSMSKFPFFLMLIFTVPLILNMDFVLSVWLVNPPEYAAILSSLILVASNIAILAGPLWTGIQAVGDIKRYNVVVGCILIMNIPATYLAFKIGCGPEIMIIIQILISVYQIVWTLFHSKRKFGLSLRVYAVKVILPLFWVTLVVISLTCFVASIVQEGWLRFILTFFICLLSLLMSVYFISLDKNEKLMVKKYVSRFL